MKKLLIYMALLLLAGSVLGAQFEAAMLFNIDGESVMDSVTISVYNLAGVLQCDTTWGYTGADHGNVPTSYDSSYGFTFTTTTLEQYKIVGIGHIAGYSIQKGKYYMWPQEATVVPADTNVRGEYLPQGNGSDASELVINGGFEADSVAGHSNVPRGWSTYEGDRNACGIITNPYDNNKLKGRWRYRLKSGAVDTLIVYQYIGSITPGIYRLSGIMYESNADRAVLFVDRGSSISKFGWHDSLIAEAAGYYPYSKTVTIYADGGSQSTYIGLCLHANSANDYADFENISFQYVAPLSFVSADTSAGGYSVTDSGQYLYDTAGTREDEYQGEAFSMTPVDIATATWQRLISLDSAEANSYAKFFADRIDAKISEVTATVSDENMGDIADSTWLKLQSAYTTPGQFGYLLDGRVDTRSTYDPDSDTVLVSGAISTFNPLSDSVMARALITLINDGVITAASIANNAITWAKIANEAIMWQHIKKDAIGANQLKTDAVTEIVDAMSEQTTDTALIKKMAQGNPSIYIGTAGSGAYEDTIYAKDTSGTDEYVSNVTISVYNQSGVLQGTEKTNSSGYAVFNLNADEWDITATSAGYQWGTGVEDTVSGAQKDSILGYNLYVDAPSGLQTCIVYGYVYNILGQVVEDAQVTVSLKGEDLQDTCSNLILTGYQADTTTNSDGYFAFELIRSSCIKPTGTKYLFRSTYPTGRTIISRQVTVPDSSTYCLTW